MSTDLRDQMELDQHTATQKKANNGNNPTGPEKAPIPMEQTVPNPSPGSQALSEEDLKKHENDLGTCIYAALEAKQNFELMSYRVLSPQQFVEKIKEIGSIINKL